MESRYENCSLLCITYTLQFLDKLSLNYAAAYTLKEDLLWCAAILILVILLVHYQQIMLFKITRC